MQDDRLPEFNYDRHRHVQQKAENAVREEYFGKTLRRAYFERCSSEHVSFFDQKDTHHMSVRVKYSK